MGHDVDFTDGGVATFREARASGLNAVTVKAGATLAGDIDFILPIALPAGTEFLTIDSAGQLGTIVGASGGLDAAYDSGGAGAGRIIVADNGAVEIQGAGGLQITHTDPELLFETTGVVFNWRVNATSGNLFQIQRGDLDTDVSDDTFESILVIDGSNRRVGIHTAPVVDLEIDASALGLGRVAAIRVGSEIGQDSSIQFFEDSTPRWEIGYDDSEGALVLGRISFTNPVILIKDTSGAVGIGETAPDAQFHVKSAAALVAVIESTSSPARLSLRDSTTTDQNTVGLDAVGNDLRLRAGGIDLVHLDAVLQRVGINTTNPGAQLEVNQPLSAQCAFFKRGGTADGTAIEFENAGTGVGLFLDQNGNGTSILIDSEATSSPLIDLLPVTGNARGDIAFGTARTADPSAPSEGDLWYDGTLERLNFETGVGTRNVRSNYGPAFGLRTVVTISVGGVLAINSPYIQVAANSGTADDLDTITSSGPVAAEGDTILLTADIGDTITVTENGNILLVGTTRVLGAAGTADTMLLVKRSDAPETWAEVSYADNS